MDERPNFDEWHTPDDPVTQPVPPPRPIPIEERPSQPPGRRSGGAWVPLVIILLACASFALTWAFLSRNDGADRQSAPTPSAASAASSAAAPTSSTREPSMSAAPDSSESASPGASTSASSASSNISASSGLPADAETCEDDTGSTAGTPIYRDTRRPTTSCAFVFALGQAAISKAAQNPSATSFSVDNVYSEATGKTYSAQCTRSGTVIHCTGQGRNPFGAYVVG